LAKFLQNRNAALGRIASTIFFFGEFFSILQNVFEKNLEMQLNCEFFFVKNGGKSAIFSTSKKNLQRKSVLFESNFFLVWKILEKSVSFSPV